MAKGKGLFVDIIKVNPKRIRKDLQPGDVVVKDNGWYTPVIGEDWKKVKLPVGTYNRIYGNKAEIIKQVTGNIYNNIKDVQTE